MSFIVVRKNQYTLGGQTGCTETDRHVFCNGKLKTYSSYCIKLRAHTAEHYLDSPCAYLSNSKSLVQQ